jgi:phosphopantothenoylcysteine synthetase/decarboxylase
VRETDNLKTFDMESMLMPDNGDIRIKAIKSHKSNFNSFLKKGGLKFRLILPINNDLAKRINMNSSLIVKEKPGARLYIGSLNESSFEPPENKPPGISRRIKKNAIQK